MIRVATALGAGLLLAGAAAAQPGAPRAPFLAAVESAPVTALARVDSAQPVDTSGYVATLTVLRPLRGTTASAQLTVLWEELRAGTRRGWRAARRCSSPSPISRRDRSGASAPPTARRACDRRRRRRADARSLRPRRRAAGALCSAGAGGRPALRASALIGIVGGASPVLAGAAVDRLRTVPSTHAAIPDAALVALLETATDGERPPPIRVAIVELAGAAPAGNAPVLEELARPGGALEAEALTALAAVDGGLPPARAEALLDRPESAVRAVGARFVTGNAVERRLPSLVRSDPDARVRAAAAVALAKTHTAWGVDGCAPALADPDPLVRSAAAEALGALGAPVVPTLEDVVRTRPAEARGALTALALAGPPGEQVLRRLSVDLPDPKLREFARLALVSPHAH